MLLETRNSKTLQDPMFPQLQTKMLEPMPPLLFSTEQRPQAPHHALFEKRPLPATQRNGDVSSPCGKMRNGHVFG